MITMSMDCDDHSSSTLSSLYPSVPYHDAALSTRRARRHGVLSSLLRPVLAVAAVTAAAAAAIIITFGTTNEHSITSISIIQTSYSSSPVPLPPSPSFPLSYPPSPSPPPSPSSSSFFPSLVLPVSALSLGIGNSSRSFTPSPFFVFGITAFRVEAELVRAWPVDGCAPMNANRNLTGRIVWMEPHHCSIETKIMHCALAGCVGAISSSFYRIAGNEMYTQWDGGASPIVDANTDVFAMTLLSVPFVHVGRDDAMVLRAALAEREAAKSAGGQTISDDEENGTTTSTTTTKPIVHYRAHASPSPSSSSPSSSARINRRRRSVEYMSALSLASSTSSSHASSLSAAAAPGPSPLYVLISSTDSPNPWQVAFSSLYFTIFFQVMLGCLHILVLLAAITKFKRYWQIRLERPLYAQVPLVCLAFLILSNFERGLYCFLDPMGAEHILPRGYRRVMLSVSVPWTYASTLLLTFFWKEAISDEGKKLISAANTGSNAANTQNNTRRGSNATSSSNMLAAAPWQHSNNAELWASAECSPHAKASIELAVRTIRSSSAASASSSCAPMHLPALPALPTLVMPGPSPHAVSMMHAHATSAASTVVITAHAAHESASSASPKAINPPATPKAKDIQCQPFQLHRDVVEKPVVERTVTIPRPSLVYTEDERKNMLFAVDPMYADDAVEDDDDSESSSGDDDEDEVDEVQSDHEHSGAPRSVSPTTIVDDIIAPVRAKPAIMYSHSHRSVPPPPPALPPMISAPPSVFKNNLAEPFVPSELALSRQISDMKVVNLDLGEDIGIGSGIARPSMSYLNVDNMPSYPSILSPSSTPVIESLAPPSAHYRFVIDSARIVDIRTPTMTPMTTVASAPNIMALAEPQPIVTVPAVHTNGPSPTELTPPFLQRYRTHFIVSSVFIALLDLTFSILDALYLLDVSTLPIVAVVFASIGLVISVMYFHGSYQVLMRYRRDTAKKIDTARYNAGELAAAAAAASVDGDDKYEYAVGRGISVPLPRGDGSPRQGPVGWGHAGGPKSAYHHDGRGREESQPDRYRTAKRQEKRGRSMSAGDHHQQQYNDMHNQQQFKPLHHYPQPIAQHHRPPPLCLSPYPAISPFHPTSSHHSSPPPLPPLSPSVLAPIHRRHRAQVVRLSQFVLGSGVGLVLYLCITLTSPQLWLWHSETAPSTSATTTLDDPITTISRDFLVLMALFIVGACQTMAF